MKQEQQNYWINSIDEISGELFSQRPVPKSILDKFQLNRFDTGNHKKENTEN